ncbi:uncharacterized protein SCODWIG_00995 [Saccharomycodes ludwigii]|uniref:UBX domain-containing protein n=1 Tax=Saccharomycodes ludwigii TaxID=36035 RepID=A0A376B421_9ASCO|nr:hypothetical protein SCDLUD_003321 [Saccharomycodes ludwigii]KAH3900347.1 hypothetical protein SCDLUD_003321 [Saccharomycodes ludwigii]SSD59234.1 uncharacterized protein SCODWIG_00995 [Saccharomycodes ludwigii]
MPIIEHEGEEYHLSHEQSEALDQFQMISSYPENDLPLIIKLLELYGWNIERALAAYYDGDWKNLVTEPAPPIHRETLPQQQQQLFNDSDDTGENLPILMDHTLFVPKLPVSKPLPVDYQTHFKLVGLGLNDNDDSKKNVSFLPSHKLLLFLLLIPQTIGSLSLKLLTLLWKLLSFSFLFNINKDVSNKNKVMKIPIKPRIYRNDSNANSGGLNSLNSIEHPEYTIKDVILKNPSFNLDTVLKNVDNTNKVFNELYSNSENEFKFMLVILLGNLLEHDDALGSQDRKDQTLSSVSSSNNKEEVDVNSVNFVKYVWSDESVQRYIDTLKVSSNNSLNVYLGDVDNQVESWCVAKNYNVGVTPTVLLLGNVLNSNNVGGAGIITRMSLLGNPKVTSSKKFLRSLKFLINRFAPELISSRTEKHDLEMERELRKLQDQAYQESLLLDKKKEEQKMIEEELKKKREIEKLAKEQEAKLNNTLYNLKWLKEAILEYQVKGGNDVALGKDKLCTLQIRTPDGTRFVKKFTGSMSSYDLYKHIGILLYLGISNLDKTEEALVMKVRNLIDNQGENTTCLKGFTKGNEIDEKNVVNVLQDEFKKYDLDNTELKFNFQLVSPFPRYEVPISEDVLISNIPSIWPKGNILVEFEEEEEEEEDYDDDDDESE